MKNESMAKFGMAIAVAAAVVIWCAPAQANTLATGKNYTWIGGASGHQTDWETIGNWGSVANFTGTAQATINSSTYYPVISAPETLGVGVGGTGTGVGPSGDQNYALYLSSSAATLAINSTLTITGGTNDYMGGVYNAGTITLNTGGALTAPTYGNLNGPTGSPGSIVLAGGTLGIAGGTLQNGVAISGYGTIAGNFTNYLSHYNIGSANFPPQGTVTANSAAGLNVTGAFTNGYNFQYYNTAALNVGTSTSSPIGTMNINTGGTLTNYGVLNVYGTLNNNTNTSVALASKGNNNTGSASLLGGTLGGTGTGGFTNSYALTAYGTIAAPFTNTYTSSTIHGTMTIPTTQVLTIASGITLINQYTLTNNGILDFKITGTGPGTYAVLQSNAAHSSFVNSNGQVEFDLSGFAEQAGQSWEFYLGSQWLSIWNQNVSVTGLASGLTYELDAVTGGEKLTLDAVPTPEPGTMVLLGIGMLGLAVYGKCRMHKES
jgi:hypothetical protein